MMDPKSELALMWEKLVAGSNDTPLGKHAQGSTTPPMSKRKAERRRKNKAAKKMRRRNRS